MATYNFLDFKGLQTYNEKIKSFIATSIEDAITKNNEDNQEDIAMGVSAYQAWVKFLKGTTSGATLNLADITTKLSDITNNITNLGNNKADKSNTYTKSEVYTKTETDNKITDVKVSVKNETTGTKVKLNQSVDSTGREITLTIDESGLNTALDGKVSKNGTDRLMTAAEGTKLAGIEALAQVNKIETITVTGGDSDISATISNKAATIDLSSFATNTELTNTKSTIDNYTVNGKKISTNPTLTAEDINNGSVTVSKEISDIKTSISDINNAIAGGTHFIGKYDKLEDISEPKNGDIAIVGNKEYIYNKPEGSTGNWVELGDTTAELKAIDDNAKAIKAIQDDKTYVKSVDGGNSSYVTVGGSIANNKLTLTVTDSIAGTFLTKANAESTYATKTELDNRQITVNGQQGSKVKVTLSNGNKGNTVNVSVDETVLDNTLSTINSNITNITKEGGTIDTKISTALDALDYERTRTATTATTEGAAYSVTVMSGIKQVNGKIESTETDTIGNITDAQIIGLFNTQA